MKTLLASIAILVAGPVSAGTGRPLTAEAAFVETLAGAAFETKGARAFPQRPVETVAFERPLVPGDSPAATVRLSSILDNVRRTSAKFDTGQDVVHVFGDKSQNKNEWFIGFAPENADAQFYKGKKVLRWWPVFRGSVNFEVGGRKYKAQLDGSLTNRMGSKLVVEAEDGRQKVSWTIAQLSKAAFEAGSPVTISGREFRLLYSQNFDESASGDFVGYTGDRSIVLMYKSGDKYEGFHWFEREIPRDTMLVSTPRAAKADDTYAAGAFSLGLRVTNGVLELYSR